MTEVETRDARAVSEAPTRPAALPSGGTSIHLDHVSQVFVQGDRVVPAVLDADLRMEPGEFVGIVGPSGCGKTTLLEMLAGTRAPSSGQVRLGGQSVSGPSSDIAYMLARDALLPWRSVLRNVELGLEVRGVKAAERAQLARQWLARVGLEGFAGARIGELSQGMRQRVAIARTLALSPRCILMDEPFAALDAQTRLLVQEEFLRHWEGADRPTVVFVTHDLGEAILLCSRIILMSRRPGVVLRDITIDLPYPRVPSRDRLDPVYLAHLDSLWDALHEASQEVRPDPDHVEAGNEAQ